MDMKKVIIQEHKLSLLKENPDTVTVSNPSEMGFFKLHWDEKDAFAFGMYGNKMYVGYNDFYSTKNNLPVSNELKTSVRAAGHLYISLFYDDLFGDDELMANDRDDFKYAGRIWLMKKVISFWEYPKSQYELKTTLDLLSNEMYKIYKIRPDFNEFLIDIGGKGFSNLIPIDEYEKNYNSSNTDSSKTQHTLSPLEKNMDDPQRNAYLHHRQKMLGNKLGGMTQAQYNNIKTFSEEKIYESLGVSDEVVNVSNIIVEKLLSEGTKKEQDTFIRYNLLISELSFIGKLWIDCILFKNDNDDIDESEVSINNPILKDDKIYETDYNGAIYLKIYSPSNIKILKEIITHEIKHIYDAYILLKKGKFNGVSQLSINNYQNKDFQNPDVQTIGNIVYYAGDDGELSTYTHQTYQELLNGVDIKETSLYKIYEILLYYKDKITKSGFDWDSVQWTIYNKTKNGKTPSIEFIKKDINDKLNKGIEQYKRNLGRVLSKINTNDSVSFNENVKNITLDIVIENVLKEMKESGDFEIGFESDGALGYAHINEENEYFQKTQDDKYITTDSGKEKLESIGLAVANKLKKYFPDAQIYNRFNHYEDWSLDYEYVVSLKTNYMNLVFTSSFRPMFNAGGNSLFNYLDGIDVNENERGKGYAKRALDAFAELHKEGVIKYLNLKDWSNGFWNKIMHRYPFIRDKYTHGYVTENNQSTSEQKLAPNGQPSKLTPELWNIVRTSEFKNWFGDWENNPQNASKIVDENGEPLVVYHGSKNEFDIFDLNKSGSSTGSAYGVGSYFTDSEDAAYDYGFNIYNVFLNIRKPFNLKKKTITPNQIQRFFIEMNKIDSDVLSNYGDVEYEGFNKVLKDAIRITYDYSDNDAEIMGGLINAGVSDTKTVLNYFTKICKKDGFIDKYGQDGNDKVFVALSSNQIKNIKAKSFDNKNDNMYENKTIIFKSPHIRILKENLELEVNADEISLHSFKPQPELCPKIWVNNKMNSRVRLKLLDIADDFINELNVPWVEIDDIIVTGSLANYNWSKFSDVDLHILLDFSKVDEKTDFVKEYFDAKKKIWNDTHQDLKIYGFPIEVYVQDINEIHTSSGYYSLERNEWIVEPKPNNINKIGLDKYIIKEKAAKIMTIIDSMFEKFNSGLDDYELDVLGTDVKKIWTKIKGMRREALKNGDEFHINNIIFKCLRRLGYLDKIWSLKRKVYDMNNSLK